MRLEEICVQIPHVETHADAFWVNLLSNLEDIQGSVVAFCVAKRFRGDPRDLMHDAILIAHDRWPEYLRSRADFKTWFIWIVRARLNQIYRTDRLPVPGARQNAKDGEFVGAVTADTLLSLDDEIVPDDGVEVEWSIIYKEIALTFKTYMQAIHPETLKGRTLRAMAELADRGERLSSRMIAELVGVSHTTIAHTIKEIRADLEELGI